jgi:hypothetical protein
VIKRIKSYLLVSGAIDNEKKQIFVSKSFPKQWHLLITELILNSLSFLLNVYIKMAFKIQLLLKAWKLHLTLARPSPGDKNYS